MREAQKCLAIREDFDEDTFVGFCEFGHAGDDLSRMTERRLDIRKRMSQPQSKKKRRVTIKLWSGRSRKRRMCLLFEVQGRSLQQIGRNALL